MRSSMSCEHVLQDTRVGKNHRGFVSGSHHLVHWKWTRGAILLLFVSSTTARREFMQPWSHLIGAEREGILWSFETGNAMNAITRGREALPCIRLRAPRYEEHCDIKTSHESSKDLLNLSSLKTSILTSQSSLPLTSLESDKPTQVTGPA